MRDEEIIAEARRRYPAGTRVDSLGGSKNELITNNEFYWSSPYYLRHNANCAVYDTISKGWANVVGIPINNTYSIY